MSKFLNMQLHHIRKVRGIKHMVSATHSTSTNITVATKGTSRIPLFPYNTGEKNSRKYM